MIRNDNRYYIIFVITGLIVYTITAFMSKGYYHPDEHYQILEFANYKLGNIQRADLPWEYQFSMRSSFMPWIAYYIIKLFNNPFHATLVLRLITAVMSVTAISFFIHAYNQTIEKHNKVVFYFLSFLLWVLPFINVRFSSETWSGISLLFALGFWEKNKKGFFSLKK